MAKEENCRCRRWERRNEAIKRGRVTGKGQGEEGEGNTRMLMEGNDW